MGPIPRIVNSQFASGSQQLNSEISVVDETVGSLVSERQAFTRSTWASGIDSLRPPPLPPELFAQLQQEQLLQTIEASQWNLHNSVVTTDTTSRWGLGTDSLHLPLLPPELLEQQLHFLQTIEGQTLEGSQWALQNGVVTTDTSSISVSEANSLQLLLSNPIEQLQEQLLQTEYDLQQVSAAMSVAPQLPQEVETSSFVPSATHEKSSIEGEEVNDKEQIKQLKEHLAQLQEKIKQLSGSSQQFLQVEDSNAGNLVVTVTDKEGSDKSDWTRFLVSSFFDEEETDEEQGVQLELAPEPVPEPIDVGGGGYDSSDEEIETEDDTEAQRVANHIPLWSWEKIPLRNFAQQYLLGFYQKKAGYETAYPSIEKQHELAEEYGCSCRQIQDALSDVRRGVNNIFEISNNKANKKKGNTEKRLCKELKISSKELKNIIDIHPGKNLKEIFYLKKTQKIVTYNPSLPSKNISSFVRKYLLGFYLKKKGYEDFYPNHLVKIVLARAANCTIKQLRKIFINFRNEIRKAFVESQSNELITIKLLKIMKINSEQFKEIIELHPEESLQKIFVPASSSQEDDIDPQQEKVTLAQSTDGSFDSTAADLEQTLLSLEETLQLGTMSNETTKNASRKHLIESDDVTDNDNLGTHRVAKRAKKSEFIYKIVRDHLLGFYRKQGCEIAYPSQEKRNEMAKKFDCNARALRVALGHFLKDINHIFEVSVDETTIKNELCAKLNISLEELEDIIKIHPEKTLQQIFCFNARNRKVVRVDAPDLSILTNPARPFARKYLLGFYLKKEGCEEFYPDHSTRLVLAEAANCTVEQINAALDSFLLQIKTIFIQFPHDTIIKINLCNLIKINSEQFDEILGMYPIGETLKKIFYPVEEEDELAHSSQGVMNPQQEEGITVTLTTAT